MSEKRNYQRELDDILLAIRESGKRPKLLLHACCAPCSSYVLEYLDPYFDILLFPYNPNITDPSEYERRVDEIRRLASELPKKEVPVLEAKHEPEKFLTAAAGLEEEPEGGRRCEACFALRLRETAAEAARQGADWFTTTLSISPLKNADLLNATGERAGEEAGVRFLNADFKKRDGFLRSTELSREYGLYRQDYCGCEFSKGKR